MTIFYDPEPSCLRQFAESLADCMDEMMHHHVNLITYHTVTTEHTSNQNQLYNWLIPKLVEAKNTKVIVVCSDATMTNLMQLTSPTTRLSADTATQSECVSSSVCNVIMKQREDESTTMQRLKDPYFLILSDVVRRWDILLNSESQIHIYTIPEQVPHLVRSLQDDGFTQREFQRLDSIQIIKVLTRCAKDAIVANTNHDQKRRLDDICSIASDIPQFFSVRKGDFNGKNNNVHEPSLADKFTSCDQLENHTKCECEVTNKTSRGKCRTFFTADLTSMPDSFSIISPCNSTASINLKYLKNCVSPNLRRHIIVQDV